MQYIYIYIYIYIYKDKWMNAYKMYINKYFKLAVVIDRGFLE